MKLSEKSQAYFDSLKKKKITGEEKFTDNEDEAKEKARQITHRKFEKRQGMKDKRIKLMIQRSNYPFMMALTLHLLNELFYGDFRITFFSRARLSSVIYHMDQYIIRAFEKTLAYDFDAKLRPSDCLMQTAFREYVAQKTLEEKIPYVGRDGIHPSEENIYEKWKRTKSSAERRLEISAKGSEATKKKILESFGLIVTNEKDR